MDQPEDHKKEALSEVASHRTRDEKGHFIHTDSSSTPQTPHDPSLVEKIIPTHVEVDKKITDETLLDVHVGNPLRKIEGILEDIKKQKAFTFDIKGSLGMAGIVLVLSTFGIFGGTKALCNKGVQSHIGVLHTTQLVDQPRSIPGITTLWNAFLVLSGKELPKARPHIVLVRKDTSVVHLEADFSIPTSLTDSSIMATGDYDACSQTLTVLSHTSLEQYTPSRGE